MVIINEHDVTKTKKQILLDLLFESERVRFPETVLIPGTPKELDAVPGNLLDANTFLPVKFAPGYRDDLQGDLGLMYRRRSIAEHLKQYNFPTLSFSQYPTTTHQIVTDLINPHLNYPLSLEDFVDETIEGEGVTEITIKARSDSYLWCGKAQVKFEPPSEDFFVLARVTELEGFTAYAA